MTVVGAVDTQGVVQSPGLSSGTYKKKKKSNPSDRKSTKHKSGSEKFSKSFHHQVSSKSSSALARRQSSASMDTEADSDYSDRPPVDIFVEEGELSD